MHASQAQTQSPSVEHLYTGGVSLLLLHSSGVECTWSALSTSPCTPARPRLRVRGRAREPGPGPSSAYHISSSAYHHQYPYYTAQLAQHRLTSAQTTRRETISCKGKSAPPHARQPGPDHTPGIPLYTGGVSLLHSSGMRSLSTSPCTQARPRPRLRGTLVYRRGIPTI